jgi:hypothetical protein
MSKDGFADPCTSNIITKVQIVLMLLNTDPKWNYQLFTTMKHKPKESSYIFSRFTEKNMKQKYIF